MVGKTKPPCLMQCRFRTSDGVTLTNAADVTFYKQVQLFKLPMFKVIKVPLFKVPLFRVTLFKVPLFPVPSTTVQIQIQNFLQVGLKWMGFKDSEYNDKYKWHNVEVADKPTGVEAGLYKCEITYAGMTASTQMRVSF